MYIGNKQKILVAVLSFALFLTIGYANEVSMMAMDDNGKSYFRLKPGESAIAGIIVEWGKDATDKTKYSEVTGSLTLTFIQATMDMQDTNEGNFCFNGC